MGVDLSLYIRMAGGFLIVINKLERILDWRQSDRQSDFQLQLCHSQQSKLGKSLNPSNLRMIILQWGKAYKDVSDTYYMHKHKSRAFIMDYDIMNNYGTTLFICLFGGGYTMPYWVYSWLCDLLLAGFGRSHMVPGIKAGQLCSRQALSLLYYLLHLILVNSVRTNIWGLEDDSIAYSIWMAI